MKITSVRTLHADGGYRTCSYVKVATDEGLVGWSEYYDNFSGASLAPAIESFGRAAMGMDPTAYGALSERLLATTRIARGGINHQAIAAIENACLDIAGKAAGVPVARLLGGPFRDRMRLYWTHCGSYRDARIMEIRPDEAPWTATFLTRPIVIEDGCMKLPDGPGWGADVDEAALAAHPVRAA